MSFFAETGETGRPRGGGGGAMLRAECKKRRCGTLRGASKRLTARLWPGDDSQSLLTETGPRTPR